MRGIHGHWVVTVLKRVTPTVARYIPLWSSPSTRKPTPVVENLAVELSLPVLTTMTCFLRYRGSNADRAYARRTL